MAALLEGDSHPRIACHVVGILGGFSVHGYSSTEGPKFELARCRGFLKNRSMMEPLVSFCVRHAAATPMSDLEWVAAVGSRVVQTFVLRVSGQRQLRFEVDPDLPNDR